MKIRELIDELLDGRDAIRTELDDIRKMPVHMNHNSTDSGLHTMVILALDKYTFIPDERDKIKEALEQAMLERHIITLGVACTGTPQRTAYSFEWRVINRANIFILSPSERSDVKAWLSRLPKPERPKVEQPSLWGQA
jgi:hypothetical protein